MTLTASVSLPTQLAVVKEEIKAKTKTAPAFIPVTVRLTIGETTQIQ